MHKSPGDKCQKEELSFWEAISCKLQIRLTHVYPLPFCRRFICVFAFAFPFSLAHHFVHCFLRFLEIAYHCRHCLQNMFVYHVYLTKMGNSRDYSLCSLIKLTSSIIGSTPTHPLYSLYFFHSP